MREKRGRRRVSAAVQVVRGSPETISHNSNDSLEKFALHFWFFKIIEIPLNLLMIVTDKGYFLRNEAASENINLY